MIGRIHATTRVAVFMPGTTHFVVLLDDNKGNTCLFEANGRTDARHTGTNHYDLKAVGDLELALLIQRELFVESQSRRHHVAVTRWESLANADGQHVLQQLRACGLQLRHRSRFPGSNRCVCRVAHFLLNLGRQAAGVMVVDTAHLGALIARREPFLAGGQMHEHHQQGGDVGIGQ